MAVVAVDHHSMNERGAVPVRQNVVVAVGYRVENLDLLVLRNSKPLLRITGALRKPHFEPRSHKNSSLGLVHQVFAL
jgi:hypothetical protein